jgi:hypothetical protein
MGLSKEVLWKKVKELPVTAVDELHVRIDIRPTPPASGNDLIRNERHLGLALANGPVRVDHKRERELALAEKATRVRDRVQRRALVARIRIRELRVRYACTRRETDLRRRTV